jgi:hypothetical protein
MFSKLKEFFENPYWAPVTQPLKNIAAFAYTPIRDFTKAVSVGWQQKSVKYSYSNGKEGSRLGNIFANLLDGGFHTMCMGLCGFLLGAGAAGISTGIAVYGGMAGAGLFGQIAATTLTSIAAAGIGAVAGPFLFAGAVAFAGAVVGLSLGAVPGVVSGTMKAFKHRSDVKNKVAVAAKLPAPQAQNGETLERISALIRDFNRLPKEERTSVVKMLNEEFTAATYNKSQEILENIDTLPQAEKEQFVRGLRGKMADMFEKVAVKDAEDAITLDDTFAVDKPLKIVRRRPNR